MLREFHEALDRDLRATFPKASVRKHAGEVDVDTMRRHAMKSVNLWCTVAAGEGVEESDDTNLRMLVEWAVFVVVGSSLELVEDDAGEKKRRRAAPVEVAEWHAEQVLCLAYDNDWGLEGCSKARRTDLRFVNLGVGLKSNVRGVERADVGLFAVWGRQELELGENILAGNATLPPFGGLDGEIQDQSLGNPTAVLVDLTTVAAMAAGSAVARFHRFARAQLRRVA